MSEWKQDQFNIDFDKDRATFHFTNAAKGMAVTVTNVKFSSSDDQTQGEAKSAARAALLAALNDLTDQIGQG